ncbi:MAG: MarR family transcriptional regulator [Candidatus Thorarchaeota archaeon]|nr:MAG: MarR family transcriptional regulator [Candidatus Thorarchaeota archaeon]
MMSKELPSSALAVLRCLAKHGPLTPREISRRSKIPARTVTDALRRLMKAKLLVRVPDLRDMRLCLYSPNREVLRNMLNMHGMDSMLGVQLTLILRA